MKKIFTFIAIILLSPLSMMAADKYYALETMSVSGTTYTSATYDGEKAKGNNVFVELPSATVNGQICFVGQSDKTDRYLYIYGEAGTAQDDTRAIQMLAAGDTIAYTAADVITVDNKPYLKFSTTHDFKFTKFIYTAEGAAPVTNPVATVTVSGPTECFVGQSITLKATFDVTPDTIWWTDKFGVSLNCNSASLVFTPEAEGSYTFVAWGQNQYNTQPAASEIHTVGVTVKPAAVACTNLIPAASGDALNVGDEVALNAMSEGGKIFVAGMKTAGTSIAYNAAGLQLGGGGADSIRVELYNLIQEGTEITLNMVAGGTSARGLNICALDKSKVYEAKWTPGANGEENSITYTVPAGSKLIGQSKFLLQRNNTVYLASVVVANCGEAIEGGEVSTDPVLAVTPATVTLDVTAANTNPSATVSFSGKNLVAGTYALTVPDLAGLSVSPASVTVGEDGKLNQEVTISYTSAVEVAAATANVSLTIGELTKTVAINYSAVLAKNYASSVNIEGWIIANGKQNIDNDHIGAAFTAVLDAANIEYGDINALDSLNDSKGNHRNEAYLGLKMKTAGAYMACWIQAGQTMRVKFGNVGGDIKVSVNGGAAQTLTKAQLANPLIYPAGEDAYLKFETTSSSTVVIKQIMIDEPIVSVMNKITYEVGEGGTVSGWTVAFPGEEVVLDITSNEGYAVNNITVNGVALVQSAPAAPISFIMPAEDVTVEATFGDTATGVENAKAGQQAQKVIRDGQVMILRDGKLFTTTGVEVR
ncbi:MAG: hypothetical protein IK073_05605 [Paludibacteraceae bacterium]|nr:hypothetical protein [Paludibacteraceae bacterium]